jgi:hypothetical protein
MCRQGAVIYGDSLRIGWIAGRNVANRDLIVIGRNG